MPNNEQISAQIIIEQRKPGEKLRPIIISEFLEKNLNIWDSVFFYIQSVITEK